jgi:hypothetical protein
MDEVTGEWRKLHNEERPDMYSSPSIIKIINKPRRMRLAENVAQICKEGNACRLLARKPKGKGPLGKPRSRWGDNDMYLEEIGWGCVEWNGLAQDRDKWGVHLITSVKIRIPKSAGKFLRSHLTCGFLRRAQLHEVSQSFQ